MVVVIRRKRMTAAIVPATTIRTILITEIETIGAIIVAKDDLGLGLGTIMVTIGTRNARVVTVEAGVMVIKVAVAPRMIPATLVLTIITENEPQILMHKIMAEDLPNCQGMACKEANIQLIRPLPKTWDPIKSCFARSVKQRKKSDGEPRNGRRTVAP
jgi:hypothetical protein